MNKTLTEKIEKLGDIKGINIKLGGDASIWGFSEKKYADEIINKINELVEAISIMQEAVKK